MGDETRPPYGYEGESPYPIGEWRHHDPLLEIEREAQGPGEAQTGPGGRPSTHDQIMAERGQLLIDYLRKPAELGGPQPSEGAEMRYISFRQIAERRRSNKR